MHAYVYLGQAHTNIWTNARTHVHRMCQWLDAMSIRVIYKHICHECMTFLYPKPASVFYKFCWHIDMVEGRKKNECKAKQIQECWKWTFAYTKIHSTMCSVHIRTFQKQTFIESLLEKTTTFDFIYTTKLTENVFWPT